MNTSKNDEEILPDGWILCQSKSNRDRKYYFNKKNGKSSWTKPKAEESPAKVDMKSKKVTSAQVPKSSGSDRKCLKRKSDGLNEASAPKIRPRSESSPLATPKIIKKLPQATTTAIKNSASKRLALLQKQLSDDIKKVDKSCDKNKKTSPTNPVKPPQKCSPKKPETQSKISRLGDLRSPNYVDSKCPITSQTPSSDSIHSIPSPCQFFAANKILSSMKAQLPEYRCNRTKPKDMFADIEEQICSQTPEYPSTKHPATPPQFSEASKIVSAINSKLAYKSGDPKDITLYTTAKERMESLRKSLTAEAEVESTEVTMKDISFVNTHEVKDNNSFVNEQVHSKEQQGLKRQMSKEAMEVEECKELRPSSPKVQCNRPAAVEKSNSEDLVLVVDTNIFIHELHVIKNVLNSHIKGYKNQPTLLVPWRVINELDRLKDNNNGNGAICKRARAAMDYLYESLPENNRIKGQPLRDANSHIYPCECPDDEILNCSLQQAERGKSVVRSYYCKSQFFVQDNLVFHIKNMSGQNRRGPIQVRSLRRELQLQPWTLWILLSNDKNLCNKASINNIKSIGLRELKAQLETQPAECADPDLQVSMKHYETCIYQLLSNILENEMRAKYDSLWQHVLFKAPPWSLRDVLQCLLKHWIAVFNEVFPRIEHIITDLNNTLHTIVNLGPKSLTQEKVNNFKELSLEVARKCQIIPEYMELAKMTVEQISRAADDRESDMKVVQAFETVWTVHSSYCAKLATGLEINHNIDDKINGTEPLEELTNKWNDFSNAIYNFTDAIKGILSVSSESSLMMEGQMGRLESSFRESLTLMAVDHSVVNRENLRVFCTKCRNMLQEAYTKFAQLTELLDECRNVMKK